MPCSTQTGSPGEVLPDGMGPPIIHNKYMSYRSTYSWILWRHILNCCSLLADVSSLCQVVLKLASILGNLTSDSKAQKKSKMNKKF